MKKLLLTPILLIGCSQQPQEAFFCDAITHGRGWADCIMETNDGIRAKLSIRIENTARPMCKSNLDGGYVTSVSTYTCR